MYALPPESANPFFEEALDISNIKGKSKMVSINLFISAKKNVVFLFSKI